ncbi:unnamed protein product [Rotaria socialis]|uniref:B box-type domain-containing protein n=1 Tax=Rotaria socialis TaxID=392032 RepID=A0A817TMQ7_9BILA|nr:unnamed protein product [Rotaria socialis]CAF4497114.1 unnamed protein product [Rotaria socialis]
MTTNLDKPLCRICNKARGVFKCDGCSDYFCFQHTGNHRQHVIKQLDHVEEIHNLVQESLAQQSAEPRQDVQALQDELMKKIDMWEHDSIAKIKKVAEETRNKLIQHTTGYLAHKKLELDKLTNELCLARQNIDFIESDVREWTNKLNKMKAEITNPVKIAVREAGVPLVTKMHIDVFESFDLFERTSGKAVFEDNGKVAVVQDGLENYVEVRGKSEYTTGKHTLSLKIEKLSGWILFGIISKLSPLQEHSYSSPSCYGWYNGDHFVYRNGENVGGQGHDAIENDIIQFSINCDQRLIRLTNERTNRTLELSVDIDKCPFPWQFHLNLNLVPTRIRILS